MSTVKRKEGALSLLARVGRRITFLARVSRNLTGYTLAVSVFALTDRRSLGSAAATAGTFTAGKSPLTVDFPASLSSSLGIGTFGWILTATAPAAGSPPEDILGGTVEIVP